MDEIKEIQWKPRRILSCVSFEQEWHNAVFACILRYSDSDEGVEKRYIVLKVTDANNGNIL